MCSSLYRFISFEQFVQIVCLRREHDVRPNVWEDTYEGYFFGALDKRENMKKPLQLLSDNCLGMTLVFCTSVPDCLLWQARAPLRGFFHPFACKFIHNIQKIFA